MEAWKKATVIALLVAALALCGIWIFSDKDDPISGIAKKLAQNYVKLRLSDINAAFENVTYHPNKSAAGEDLSIVCGTVRPSRPPLQRRRFLYHVAEKDKGISISGIDPRLDDIIFKLCDRD
jgi:hypothetical protein